MFNPQLDALDWRVVERKIDDDHWVVTNLIDIKEGDTFRLTDPGGSSVEDSEGNTEFIAKGDGHIGAIGIPTVVIK